MNDETLELAKSIRHDLAGFRMSIKALKTLCAADPDGAALCEALLAKLDQILETLKKTG